jgi:phosphatidylglycerol---prolipoprotein diacylglyceryl transferase
MIDFFPSRAVAIDLFGFSVHWYGLLYFAAFAVAWFLVPRLQRYRDLSLSPDEWSRLVSWAVVGVIVGGRLGFVLFYDPAYYIAHPLEIFAVWKGGMASHGGFIGVTLAMLWALRSRKSDVLRIADVVVIPVAIGLAFGRLGNFINQELYGTVTSLPWGMEFPGADGLRHPVQLYAVAKDLLIAAVCFIHLTRRPYVAGHTISLFLLLYGVLRFLTEFVREQNGAIYHGLSEGQWLTIPVFIAGIILWVWTGKRRA